MATQPNSPVQPQYLEAESKKRLRKSREEMSAVEKARQARQQAGPGNAGFERFMDMHKEARGAKVLSGKRPGKGWRYTSGPYKGQHPSDANRSAYQMWDKMGEQNRDKFRKKGAGDYAADRERGLERREDEFNQDLEFDRRRRDMLGQGNGQNIPTNTPGGQTNLPNFNPPGTGTTPTNTPSKPTNTPGTGTTPANTPSQPTNMPVSTTGGGNTTPVSSPGGENTTPVSSPVQKPQPRGMIDGMPAKKAIDKATKRVNKMRNAAPKKSNEEYQRDMQSSRVDLIEKRQKEAERARIDSMRGPASNPAYRERQADAIRAEYRAENARKDKIKQEREVAAETARNQRMQDDYLSKVITDVYGSVENAPVNVGYGVNSKGGKLTPEDLGAPSYDDYTKAERMKATMSGNLSDTAAAAKTPVTKARRSGPRGKR